MNGNLASWLYSVCGGGFVLGLFVLVLAWLCQIGFIADLFDSSRELD